MNFGIEAMELYIPNTYVDQQELEAYNGVSKGKYTKGLGQLQLSFTYPCEDVNSLALTVVNNLLQKNGINPGQVGRLEVGTETLTDKSKSTKTVLMSLFKGHHDIEGATSFNACYGATNALLNTLNWMGSPSWDGRYGIVVAADVAVYEDGPARPTGGAGAVAMLISNKPKISFSPIRASYIDHQYDFYKPLPGSEYPIVDGKLSIECYLKAMRECYSKLKEKTKREDIIETSDYFCFHCPYYKMVQKAFAHLLKTNEPSISDEQIVDEFKRKVQPTLFIAQKVGNIYTGSLFACLYSLLYKNKEIRDKKVVLFSYGSGLCSSMLEVYIHSNPLRNESFEETDHFFQKRIKIDVQTYKAVMLEKQQNYGKWRGQFFVNESILLENTFYLSEIDDKWRRHYAKQPESLKLVKDEIGNSERIKTLIDKRISAPELSKFYKLSVQERRSALGSKVNEQMLETGGITSFCADKMIENVIGKLSLPLGVVPKLPINHKKYTIPMCIEQPSVVAATSSIGKFITPYSFITSSSPSIMMGQVHLPSINETQVNAIESVKDSLVHQLNEICPSMTRRNGGVKSIRLRNLENKELGGNDYSLDIFVDVREAMGANIVNTVGQRAKEIILSMGIRTGISILTNYCIERRSTSSFVIPVEHMSWKGHQGLEVAEKIVEAYQFARKDHFRAVTHNKGIMNGIDAVCIATGQDWRAIQSGAHAYAAKNGKYQPLSHYRIFQKDGFKYFEGKIELPIAVGTVGGAIARNPLYKASLKMMDLPNAQQFAQILVSVGLAQNFAALRALAIEGIQKGHMNLHSRAISAMHGVPPHLIEECCQFMTKRHKYDKQTIRLFLECSNRPHL